MTDEQVGIFLDICEIHRQNYYVMFSLMLSSGIRLGEAIALRKSSVNWRTGRVAIKESFRRQLGKTKNKRDRKIDLDPDMLLLLKNQAAKDDGDLMFPHPETCGYLSQNTVRGNYQWVYLKAGLPLVRKNGKQVPMWPHTARHTFATSAMEDNPNQLEAISQYLGHHSPEITNTIYSHVRSHQRPTSGINLKREKNGPKTADLRRIAPEKVTPKVAPCKVKRP